MEIKVGKVYRCKRKKIFGIFDPVYDDRQVLWISEDKQKIQYDCPSLRIGRRRPIVDREKFEKWADQDVTDRLPAGDWEKYEKINK